MHYFALCCIVRDESPFLREWLTFHALAGVEHFYVYDNMSEIPVRDTLAGFADAKRVTVRRLSGKAMQNAAYQNCLDDFGPACNWMGFIDLDEFLCPVCDADLRVLLTEFEEYAGLAVPWTLFSSGGHLGRPAGPVIKNYTQRLPLEQHAHAIHIKSVIRPARTRAVLTPHTFQLAPGEVCVNEDHFPVPPAAPFTFSRQKKVRLNHYFYRSQQDYEEKMARGRADIGDAGRRTLDPFYAQAGAHVEEDTAVLRFLPALEKSLRTGSLPAAPVYVADEAEYYQFMDTALAFANAGQLEKAALCLTHAVNRHGNIAELWVLRALIARLAGRHDRAERFIRKALSLEEVPNIYLELAALLKARDRNEEAACVQLFLRQLLKMRGLSGK